jgi:glycyl-tRNA synthetase beta chain
MQGDLDFQQLDPKAVVRPDLFEKSSEPAFYQALVELVPRTQAAQQERNYQQIVDALAEVTPIVSTFFDDKEAGVMVMDENPEIRRNRLNLLGLLRNHARVLAEFGAIVK